MELVVEGLSHRFGALTVLDDIGLRAGPGEIVAVVGPSGCGKSTLLGLIGGLLRPQCGQIRREGAPPVDSLNPFTFVFQDFALLPWRTVARNVALPLEHHPLRPAERAAMVVDALRRTGLDEFAEAYPKQLSGGMRQRVGIARALVVRPAMLLMDEPFSALDGQTRELLIDDFLALWRETRLSAIYVTHNLDEAVRVADRVLVMTRRPGRFKAEIHITMPQLQRPTDPQALTGWREQLWRAIREEAQQADRELSDVG
ncbi:MAG: ABC transporter ATP-binding protein [Alphaproteobacteria bacterium]|nr:ABC transporter ATP-binding protein [Alphaproteobacteria bacterium]